MIKVTFINGRSATYTKAVLSMMMYDNEVIKIVDVRTGEVLKG